MGKTTFLMISKDEVWGKFFPGLGWDSSLITWLAQT